MHDQEYMKLNQRKSTQALHESLEVWNARFVHINKECTIVLVRSEKDWIVSQPCISILYYYLVVSLFMLSISIVRVNSRDDINRYVEQRKLEMEIQRDANQRKNEALKVIEGGVSGSGSKNGSGSGPVLVVVVRQSFPDFLP